MRTGIALGLMGFFALAGGCASPAHYVEKKPDSGIVSIPANNGLFADYYRKEALDLIQKHVGPNYEIIEVRKVVTGQSTTNNQQVNTEAIPNKRNPNQPGERQTITNDTTQRDITEVYIWYRQKSVPLGSNQPYGAPGGVMQTGGVRPQGQPQGTTPDVVPSVLPRAPQSSTGPTSYFVRPRPANVTPACAS